MSYEKVALITGCARRVGAVVARKLHENQMRIVIHYRSSADQAKALCDELNAKQPNTATIISGDLNKISEVEELAKNAAKHWGRLDVLINNASSFYPTPMGKATEKDWNDLIGSNVKAPFFLAQAAAPFLIASHGCIVNMVDIHATQPLKDHPIYCIGKAGLLMLTKLLAKELGPNVRVNAIAPGAVLWPDANSENEIEKSLQDKIIARTALKRVGTPEDIAKTILFLVKDADYITGQVLAVDGGRSLNF